jgi:hypothetical protein
VFHRPGLMGVAAVLVVLAGVVLNVETWSAKDAEETAAHRGIRPVRFLTDKSSRSEADRELAERIAEYLGMPRDEVDALIDKGVTQSDLISAAAIAKLGDRDLQAVLKAKTEQKAWPTVAREWNIDAREFRKERHRISPAKKGKEIWLDQHPEVVLKSIAEYLEMDEKKLAAMIKQERVRPREWLKGAVLSRVSGKPLTEVMAMKKKRSWLEVATALGVSREEVQTEMHRLKKILKKHAKRYEEHRETGADEKMKEFFR